jgi:hypothetical protein
MQLRHSQSPAAKPHHRRSLHFSPSPSAVQLDELIEASNPSSDGDHLDALYRPYDFE